MNGAASKGRRIPPLRRHVFLLLSVFVLVTLCILWVFQIFLLKPMYASLKTHELKRVSARLVRSVDSPSLSSLSDKLAQSSGICVSVYEITGQTARLSVNSHIRASCILHNLASDSMMNRLYAGALSHGFYTERIRGNFLTGAAVDAKSEVPESIITSTMTENGDKKYLILLNAEIEPVGTTTDTLILQLSIISGILLLAAGITAVLVSGAISKPIAQMSREANKLALGSYDVHFDGGMSKETAELGEALNYAAKELSSIDTMQKDLMANISHDLRTPLTMISGYSEVMRDIPGEMTAENMQIIIDETERLTALVNDILDLSKLSGGSQTLQCTVLSLTNTVRHTLDRYQKLRTQEGYRITFDFDREAYIYADESKILQVIYNLVNNAINYTGEDKSVTIRQICDDGQCRIEVTDTGEGIPADQLPMIWDRYYKVKNYYRRAVTGTGLGLSIVKNILLLHGAKFGVSSTEGVGSTFWFSLPEISPDADKTSPHISP